jgi:hypothetical protein
MTGNIMTKRKRTGNIMTKRKRTGNIMTKRKKDRQYNDQKIKGQAM